MTIKRAVFILSIALVLLGTAGCGTPEYVEHSIDDACSSAKNGDWIKVTGVIKPIDIIERDQRYRILLVKDLDQDQPWIGVWIRKGKGKHRMQPITDNFRWEDVQVQTADGRMAGGGDTVTVSGRFSPTCDLKVYLIE